MGDDHAGRVVAGYVVEVGDLAIPFAFHYQLPMTSQGWVTPMPGFEERRGRCYELAVKLATAMSLEGLRPTVVHGTIQQSPDAPPNPHAWVICVDLLFDVVLGVVFPDEYYELVYGAAGREEYDFVRLAAEMLRNSDYGPWGEEAERVAAEQEAVRRAAG